MVGRQLDGGGPVLGRSTRALVGRVGSSGQRHLGQPVSLELDTDIPGFRNAVLADPHGAVLSVSTLALGG